ncbi:unnamed protein product, partial [Ectocarpus sp. 12 AP-2014]
MVGQSLRSVSCTMADVSVWGAFFSAGLFDWHRVKITESFCTSTFFFCGAGKFSGHICTGTEHRSPLVIICFHVHRGICFSEHVNGRSSASFPQTSKQAPPSQLLVVFMQGLPHLLCPPSNVLHLPE